MSGITIPSTLFMPVIYLPGLVLNGGGGGGGGKILNPSWQNMDLGFWVGRKKIFE